MNEPGSKPFEISKQAVAAAFEKVRSNKGAAGVDGVTVEQFAQEYKNNLYKEAYAKRSLKKWSARTARKVNIQVFRRG